jgi:Ca2+/Na+ antiporter
VQSVAQRENSIGCALLTRKADKLRANHHFFTAFNGVTSLFVGNFSDAVGVDPFLVAFVVTPLASNASEVVSSLMFARKKRKINTSLCYSQIYGAITMNNTLCLGIFLAIVHLRGLTWDFSAEVTAMVAVILAVGAIGSSRQTFGLGWALPVALLYPISLLGVEFLEGSLGWH